MDILKTKQISTAAFNKQLLPKPTELACWSSGMILA